MCSPHSPQHLLDLTFGLRELLCIPGAQLTFVLAAVLWIEERIALDRDPRIGFGDLTELHTNVTLAANPRVEFRGHTNADLELRRHLIEKGHAASGCERTSGR